ncbi:MAG: nitroreductase family protein [Spirochaetales bacterium]|nr:nitroreductase family protein [Spirochaetales bacterium]
MIELLLSRRSTRKFLTRKVEQEKKDKLIEAALLSPTAKNLHSCEFITVENENLIKTLAGSKRHGASFMAEAPMAIVIIGNTDKTDVWVEDAAIAAITVQLEAEGLGLGSCWVQIRNRHYSENKTAGDYVKELLNIPENYEVEAVIAIGYKGTPTKDNLLETLDRSRIHTEKYRS